MKDEYFELNFSWVVSNTVHVKNNVTHIDKYSF